MRRERDPSVFLHKPRDRKPFGAFRPARDITLAVAFKLLLLIVISQLFFTSAQRPHVDAAAVSAHLLTNPAFSDPNGAKP